MTTAVNSRACHPVSAGAVRGQFCDGQLRYLCVAGREVIRRIYFAVRDAGFDTPAPRFDRLALDCRDGGFVAEIAATCSWSGGEYAWEGRITGCSDGRITFAVRGRVVRGFESPRIGINVLLGTWLGGEGFCTADAAGTRREMVLPHAVAPPEWDFARWFTSLGYRTDAAAVDLRLEGGHAGIEDQRNYCDSSYKVYGYLPHEYRQLQAGASAEQTLHVHVRPLDCACEGGPAATVVRLGPALPDARMPRVVIGDSRGCPAAGTRFDRLNDGSQIASASRLCWTFNPSSHLPDDAMYMENLPALLEQVQFVRSVNPAARVCIDPLCFDSRHSRPGPDWRNGTPFGAAWCAAAGKYLALAGVDEAVFAVGPGPAGAVQRALADLAGRRLLDVRVVQPAPPAIEAWAAEAANGKPAELWLVNITDRQQTASVEGLRAVSLPPYRVQRLQLA